MMKQKALKKDFFMEIKKAKGRFLSILFIVALGTAFFAGIRSTESAMKITGDAYYDSTNLMDIKVVSTLGLTDEDISAFETLEVVAKAEGGYSVDVIHAASESRNALRVMSLLPSMNGYLFTEGEMPKKKGESLIDEQYANRNGLHVGDTISFESGTEKELSDTLNSTEYVITGIVNTAQYISFQRGNTNIGTGEISGFAVVMPEDFAKQEIYTEIYIRVSGAEEEIAYFPNYMQKIEHAIEKIEEISDIRRIARYEFVVDEANKELEEAREEFETEKKKAEEELEEAEKELEEAKAEIEDAKAQIQDGLTQIENGKSELYTQQRNIDTGKISYQNEYANLEEGKREYENGEEAYAAEYALRMPEVEAGEVQIAGAREEITQQREGFEQMKPMLTEEEIEIYEMQLYISEVEIEEQAGILADARMQFAQSRAQLDTAKAQLEDGEVQLAAAKMQLDEGQRQINAAWVTIYANEAEIADAQIKLVEGEEELEKGQKEYEDGVKEANEEFQKAEVELTQAREDIDEIEVPKWYITDRDSLPEYAAFGDNAARMQAIGKVFPVVFFLVAALISLTAMTRMVEEQRVQIGTLKALGYTKRSIMMKYVGYAFLATLFGSILGVLVGGKLFPYVIISAYKIMYTDIPKILVPYHISYALWAAGAALACTMGATFFASYKELAMKPAVLMRPPAPKKGKRVFLERLSFVWNRLNFTWKSTIRNLVRYKKRFFMTVFGIGACMGMMLVGFGLRDSILDVAVLQFSNIQLAEGTAYLKEEPSAKEKEEIYAHFEEDKDVESFMEFYEHAATLKNGKFDESIYITIPKEMKHMEQFFIFKDRKSKEVYFLQEEKVIITEKLSNMLGAGVGDTIYLTLKDFEEKELKVSAITENYIGHYVYLSSELYEQLYGELPEYNTVQFNTPSEIETGELLKTGEQMIKLSGVQSVVYTHTMKGILDGMLTSLDMVMGVLIISAGLLAFVVLYNLNTININERRRELATIKVLGFYDKEVSAYVYRENTLLTIVGMLVGALWGKILHYFVIVTVEVEMVMFGRNINLPSYIYGALFTVVFSVFVNLVMFYKLKKIDMVESLKSAE